MTKSARSLPQTLTHTLTQTLTQTLCLALLLGPGLAAAAPVDAQAVLEPLRALQAKGVRVGASFRVEGREVAALEGDLALNPASVSKVFSAAFAVDRLGPDHRVKLRVRQAGGGADDAVLVVSGGGDPLLKAADLAEVARCVAGAGVRRVSRVVVDPSPFSRDSLPPAFDTKNTDSAYRAGCAGLQVDLNAVEVTVKPGVPGEPAVVTVEPASAYVRIENTTTSAAAGTKKKKTKAKPGRKVEKREPLRIDSLAGPDGRLVIRVSGTVKAKGGATVLKRVPDPAANAGYVFVAALAAAGVKGPERVDTTSEPPAGGRELCTRDSAPLSAWLAPMLQDSLNPVAEAVLRAAGARDAKGPVGFGEGARGLAAFLEKEVGLARGSFRFVNGSGLYDANRATARATVRLLEHLRGHDSLKAVVDSLPVAGRSGTLRNRLKKTPLEGRVRAKTGTLDDAVALAGFLDLPGGKVATFAVIAAAPETPPGPKGRPPVGFDRAGARRATDQALTRLFQQF